MKHFLNPTQTMGNICSEVNTLTATQTLAAGDYV